MNREIGGKMQSEAFFPPNILIAVTVTCISRCTKSPL